MTTMIVLSVAVVAVLGLILGVILAVASKVMEVKEDERIGHVRELLPGANCGACGYAGCDDYAKAIIESGAATNLCIPGADGVAKAISDLLGVEASDVVEMVAVVRCKGTCTGDDPKTSDKMIYTGIPSCAACNMTFSGKGACDYGCLGFGDCVNVCPNDAIHVVDGVAVVDRRKCIGCGLCAKTCPKKIIDMIPDVKPIWVQCSNQDKGAVTRKVCSTGCIGCKRCEKECPADAIHVENNLAAIDVEKCIDCGKCAEVCPAHCISVLSPAPARSSSAGDAIAG